MANQKTYQLTINGITETITQVEALNAQLDALDERLKNLGGGGVKVDIGGTSSEASELTVEYQKQLEVAKQLKQLQKEIAQGARDENGEFTQTLKGKRAYLAELKKELSTMELGTDEWDAFSKKVNEVNTEVKNLEKSFGDMQRNVGNYQSALDGMSKLQVAVGGNVREYNSFKEASKNLETELKNLAVQMKELEESGQGSSDEFNALKQQFEDVAKAAEQLDKAKDYAERMKESIQDDSGAVGELSRSFESFSNIVQVGIGVTGLFGQSQEELTEAINKTVQVTTILKGVQSIFNNDLQKGAPIVKMYQATVNGLSTAFGVDAASTTLAATATKLFSKALVATGIGAIIVAIGTLVANFDELTSWLGKAIGGTEGFSKAWDKAKEIVMGVGTAIVKFLIGPIKTAINVLKNLVELDFEGAFNAMVDGVKDTYDVVGNYQKGANAQAARNAEDRRKALAKVNEKEKKDYLELNEAKYGSDWKYSEDAKKLYDEMFDLRMSQYAVDSEEYRQAQLDKIRYDREFEEHKKKAADDAAKADKEAAKRRAEAAKTAADNLKKVEEKLASDRLAIMQNGFEKELKALKLERQKELDAAKASGIKIREQEQAINDKYDLLELEKRREHNEKLEQLARTVSANIANLNKGTFNLSVDTYDLRTEALKWQAEMYKFTESALITPLDKGGEEANKSVSKYFELIDKNLETNLRNSERDFAKFNSMLKGFVKDSVNGYEIYSEEDSLINRLFKINTQAAFTEITKNYNELGKELDGLLKSYIDEQLAKGAKKSEIMADRVFQNLKYISDSIKFITIQDEKSADDTINKITELFNTIEKYYGSSSKVLVDISKKTEESLNSIFENGKELQSQSLRKFYDDLVDYQNQVSSQYIGLYKSQYEELTKINEKFNKEVQSGNYFADSIGAIIQASNGIKKMGKEYDRLSKSIIYYQVQLKNSLVQDEEKKRSIDTEIDVIEELIGTYKILQEAIEENDTDNIAKYTATFAQLKSLMKERVFEEFAVDIDTLGENFERVMEGIKDKLSANSYGLGAKIVDARSASNELEKLLDSIDSFKKKSEKSWKDWAAMSMQVVIEAVGVAASMIDSISTTMYNNAMKRIEEVEDALDEEYEARVEEYEKETEALEDKLKTEEELIADHNERINELEGELSTARGERRLEILDQITQESNQREKALLKQKQIQKQEAIINKKKLEDEKAYNAKKEELEQKKEEAEKKRNKQQKAASIMMAVVNTAVAVTRTLASTYYPLNVVMAALVGALGAAEIATIASQKLANGGVIQGKSHSEGGVKVLGGQAEVEGGEFITNKRTTAKNLPLLEYINAHNDAVTMDDLESFFGRKPSAYKRLSVARFADGGLIPQTAPNIDNRKLIKGMMQDNRPIVVSVVDVIDAEDRLRSVQTLAGEI